MRHILTATGVTALHRTKAKGRAADGGNLYLVDGAAWQMRFVWHGKPQTLSIGRYPIVSLAAARAERDEAAAKLAAGTDPRTRATTGDDFATVGGRWLKTQVTAPKTIKRHAGGIASAARAFGGKPIAAITVGDVRQFFDALHASGLHGKFKKVRDTLAGVWRYAVIHELVTIDPIALLRGAYKLNDVVHFPHLEGAKAIGELMCRLHAYHSVAGAGIALRLQLLTMVRPGEACAAQWAEMELDGAAPMWRIPPRRMKEKRAHHVPLSTQAVALLKAQGPLSRGLVHVFPGLRRKTACITTAAVEGALRSMGYDGKKELVPHGLRATASTYLNSVGANKDDIELCLAHADEDEVRATYNHATRLPERRILLQQWADALGTMALGRG